MELKRPPDATVLIPCYNEENILPQTLRRRFEAAQQFPFETEIIVCDDGSTDQTAAIARAAGVKTVSYARNRGKGCALRTGAAVSTGEVLLLTDADLAYGVQPLEEAYRMLTEGGYDLVCGSRRLAGAGDRGYPLSRKLASRGFSLFQRVALGLPMSDTQCGLKALRGEVGRSLFADCRVNSFAYDLELLSLALRRGCTYAELPVQLESHHASSVHLLRDSLRMAAETLHIRRRMKRMR